MCKHILCCLCLCMAELLQKDYILKRFCLQSHILIIDLVIFNQYNRESKWRRIEAVITGRTRNALALRGTRVRIPPSPSLRNPVTIQVAGFFSSSPKIAEQDNRLAQHIFVGYRRHIPISAARSSIRLARRSFRYSGSREF